MVEKDVCVCACMCICVLDANPTITPVKEEEEARKDYGKDERNVSDEF